MGVSTHAGLMSPARSTGWSVVIAGESRRKWGQSPFRTLVASPALADPYDWQALYPAGVRREPATPHAPLWHVLGSSARMSPHAVAIRYDDLEIRYGTLWSLACDIANRLGRGRGARLLLWLPNCPEFVAWYHGALIAGWVVVAASPHLTPAEIGPILDDAE